MHVHLPAFLCQFFEHFSFAHAAWCPDTLFATTLFLTYAIIASSSVVKLPQMVKIFQAKSGNCISLTGVTLELLANSATWAYSFRYGFPFSSYGEAVFLSVQHCAVAAMVLFYSSGREETLNLWSFAFPQVTSGGVQALTYTSVYVVTLSVLMSPIVAVPAQILVSLQASEFFGKMTQIYTNFQAGSTGELSSVTRVLLLLVTLFRVLTSVLDAGDSRVDLTVWKYVLYSVLNGLILLQIMWYWESSVRQQNAESRNLSRLRDNHSPSMTSESLDLDVSPQVGNGERGRKRHKRRRN